MLTGEIIPIGEADGGITAHVEFVEIGGEQYVLKTDSKFDVAGETLFQAYLADLELPHIQVFQHDDLQENQMLMERIDAETLAGPNYNPDNLRKLGRVLQTVHSKQFDLFEYLDEAGKLKTGHWDMFVDTMIQNAMKVAQRSEVESAGVERAGQRLKALAPSSFVLCHGDIHGNNAFNTENGIVLFDNNADAFVATATYDLATLFGENLMGYRYGEAFEQRDTDVARMEAFLEGYGELPEDFEATIDDYVLLRLLARYPHPAIKYQDELILHLANSKVS